MSTPDISVSPDMSCVMRSGTMPVPIPGNQTPPLVEGAAGGGGFLYFHIVIPPLRKFQVWSFL